MAGQLIDWDQLDAIADGWGQEFLEIYQEFLTDLPADIGALRRALDSDDAVASSGLAHRVKGSAANFGFEAVRQVALDVEAAVSIPDLAMACARFQQVDGLLAASRAEVAARVPAAA